MCISSITVFFGEMLNTTEGKVYHISFKLWPFEWCNKSRNILAWSLLPWHHEAAVGHPKCSPNSRIMEHRKVNQWSIKSQGMTDNYTTAGDV